MAVDRPPKEHIACSVCVNRKGVANMATRCQHLFQQGLGMGGLSGPGGWLQKLHACIGLANSELVLNCLFIRRGH
eukprot:1152091-Pelagomonas_calceolata.AAC.7